VLTSRRTASAYLLRRAGGASCSCNCCTLVVCFSKLIFKFPLSVVVAVRLPLASGTPLAEIILPPLFPLTRVPKAGDDLPLWCWMTDEEPPLGPPLLAPP